MPHRELGLEREAHTVFRSAFQLAAMRQHTIQGFGTLHGMLRAPSTLGTAHTVRIVTFHETGIRL